MTPRVLLLLAAVWAAPPAAASNKRAEVPTSSLPGAVVPTVPAVDLRLSPLTVGAQLPVQAVQSVPELPVTPVPTAQAASAWAAAPTAQAQTPGAWIAAPTAQGPEEGLEAQATSGRVRFDAASAKADELVLASLPQAQGTVEQLVSAHAGRRLRNVFVQNEQEGSLVASDPRDSSGDIFRWYRPAQMRPELVAEVEAEMGSIARGVYKVKRALSSKKDPYAAWKAFGRQAKLSYLDGLEKSVVAEKSPRAAWDGKVSLLLERTAAAPEYLTKNPHMEAPPARLKDAVGAKFLQPELVTDKSAPAMSVSEALVRTSYVISQTGHAGTQYHVFMKLDPAAFRARVGHVTAALQLFNDVLFAKAARESFENVVHASLMPWHAGRSARVVSLGKQGRPSAPAADDPDSEKHAFVGFRFWGVEDGKLVVSFELRGASLPFKNKNRPAARDMGETPAMPERDYSEVRRFLTFVALYAEKVAAGRAPPLRGRAVGLDAAAVDRYLAVRANRMGMPRDAYYGIEDFSRRVLGEDRVAPGLLFPFAADPEGAVFLADELLKASARLKAVDQAGPDALDEQRKTYQYMFWQEFGSWAARYGARRERELESLFRAVAAD